MSRNWMRDRVWNNEEELMNLLHFILRENLFLFCGWRVGKSLAHYQLSSAPTPNANRGQLNYHLSWFTNNLQPIPSETEFSLLLLRISNWLLAFFMAHPPPTTPPTRRIRGTILHPSPCRESRENVQFTWKATPNRHNYLRPVPVASINKGPLSESRTGHNRFLVTCHQEDSWVNG